MDVISPALSVAGEYFSSGRLFRRRKCICLSLPVRLSPVRSVGRCRQWGGRTTSQVPVGGCVCVPGGGLAGAVASLGP